MRFKSLLLIVFIVFSVVHLSAEPLLASSELLSDLEPEILDILQQHNHVFRYDEELSGNLYIPETSGGGGYKAA